MRAKTLFWGDVRFQWKYGFYFLYLVFTLMYVLLLHIFPIAWRTKAAMLMIFSDPAAIGFFFMGAIVQLEKDEKTLQSISISPVKRYEYVLSKLFSLGAIATLVALCIGFAGNLVGHPFRFIVAVFTGSCLFSAIGMVIATQTKTLNQFIVATIPCELIINIPAFAYVFGWDHPLMLLHPGCCLMELCLVGNRVALAYLSLFIWTVLAILYTVHAVQVFFNTLGGSKT
ncbi:MAG: hypothetical protein AB9828_02630 [Sphaerochaetaceae bacterium]